VVIAFHPIRRLCMKIKQIHDAAIPDSDEESLFFKETASGKGMYKAK
jgi:hypothetical protein